MTASTAPARPAPTPLTARLSSTRLTGLDGLRAIAVVLVLVYHLFPAAAPGGFVGVDVFFVISGFLITTLLLREREATGRVRLRSFWARRARRLLPALAVVVAVCTTAAAFLGGDVLVGIGAQLLGAVTFSSNWFSIAGSGDYFAATTPQLFENFWSLAVEEQFYLVWPVLLLVVVVRLGSRTRVIVAALAAAASAGWMAALVLTGADTTRAYFGTDSHAFGLLLGIALALGLQRWLDLPSNWMPSTRGAELAAGAGAVIAILIAAAVPATATIGTFPGVLLAASLATALAIRITVTEPAFGRALDAAPLRWIGERSYGLYLWHWPIAVLFAGGDPAVELDPWAATIVLALTLAAAALSYRFVESPIRRLGFWGALGALRRWARRSAGGRAALAAAAMATLGLVAGSGVAVAVAPRVSSAEDLILIGAEAVQHADETPPVLPDPRPRVKHEFVVEPRPVDGRRISAIGDSVMLASAPALQDAMPGIQIDAEVSRSMWTAPGLVKNLSSEGRLRRFVVIALATNGTVDGQSVQDAIRRVGDDHFVILVTAYGDRSWIPPGNRELRAIAKQHPNVRIADWHGAIEQRTDLLAGDGIHPGPAGGAVFARTVKREVQAFENEIAGARTAARVSRIAVRMLEAGPGATARDRG